MTQYASAANSKPEPPYILALDIGTSSTRALLFDATGNTFPDVLAQRPYQLRIRLADVHGREYSKREV